MKGNVIAARRTAAKAAESQGPVPLVSVIMPVFNGETYLAEAIESVMSQRFSSWELIIVDDCSTDKSTSIAESYAATDGRVTVLEQPRNMGAAKARNRALSRSRGRYVAYLDCDDLWLPAKLEAQLAFMERHASGMCFTSYETINESGSHRNYISVPAVSSYRQFLKRPVTCAHTVVFDTTLVPKSLLQMPDMRRRQDGATWLAVLKSGVTAHGLDVCLAKNRKRSGSLSSSKLAAVRSTWYLYRHVERLNPQYAAYCLAWQLFHALVKRRGRVRA